MNVCWGGGGPHRVPAFRRLPAFVADFVAPCAHSSAMNGSAGPAGGLPETVAHPLSSVTAWPTTRCSSGSRRPCGSGSRTSFPEPTAAQVQGWPPIADGRAHPDLRPHRQRQDAHRLPVRDRPAGHRADPGARRSAPGCSTSRRCGRWRSTSRRTCGPRWPASGWRPSGSGVAFTEPVVGVRTGDTRANDRQALIRRPPDLLITTPESLYLMLTSSARDTLAGVETVIIDEIHAMAPTKRGAHLALSLERLEEVTERPPQRIGLSATQRPLEEVARFLGGYVGAGPPRPVTIVDAGIRKPLEVEVVIPVEDMGDLGQAIAGAAQRPGRRRARPVRKSIWPSIYPRILELVLAHRSTIIFCNARRLAERLAARLNELADDARGHRPARPSGRRAGQGPPRLAGPRAAGGDRGPAQARRAARRSSPRRRSSSASTWAPSTSSSRSSPRGR